MIGYVNQPSTNQIMDVDGTLKAGAVDTAEVIASGVVIASKIASGVIGATYQTGVDYSLEGATDAINEIDARIDALVLASGDSDIEVADARDGETVLGDRLDKIEYGIHNVLRYGAIGDGTTDDATAIQAAIDAVAAIGSGIVFFPAGRTYLLDSLPLALPVNLAGKMVLSGYGATIKLSATVGAAFCANPSAGGDVAQNYIITGFTIDVDNQDTLRAAVILYWFDSMNLNWDNIIVRDIVAVNVPAPTSGGAIFGIRIVSSRDNPDAAAQNYIKNILIENVRIEGGSVGIAVTGRSNSGLPTDANIWIDNVTLRNCYHDIGAYVYAPNGAGNFHVGSVGLVGHVVIENCVGKNAGDIGIELNNAAHGIVRDCHIENAAQPYYIRNYHTVDVDANYTILQNCIYVNSGIVFVAAPFTVAGTLAVGTVILDNCRYINYGNNLQAVPYGTDAVHIGLSANIKRVVIRNCEFISSGWTFAEGADVHTRVINIAPQFAGRTIVELSNVRVRYAGTNDDIAYAPYLHGIVIGGLAGATTEIELLARDISIEFDVSNTKNGSQYGIELGSPDVVLAGVIDGAVIACGDGLYNQGIRLSGTTTPTALTILDANGITLSNYKVTGVTDQGHIYFVSDTIKPYVFDLGIPRRTYAAVTSSPYAMKNGDYDNIIGCNATTGAIEVDLLSAVGAQGRTVTIIKTDASANVVTIDPNASETINGSPTSLTLADQYDSVTLISNGSNWFKVSAVGI
jgi:hypothetical protein